MSNKPPLLIRQSWIAFAAMLLPILASFFAPDYNPVAQHMSALGRADHWSGAAMQVGAVLAGILFGAAMVANALFPMGSPLHGLYGLAIFLVLVPAFFIAEFGQYYAAAWLRPYCLSTSFIGLAYMWILLVGLDPQGYAGLTQRLATVVSFGWFAVVALCGQKIGNS